MNEVQFFYGTKSKYDALENKDTNTLYFLTDTLQIFKGTDDYTKSTKLVSSLPDTGQIQGIIYIKTTDFSMYIYNGTEFVQINKTYTTAIPENPNDDTVPTTKAVADYVTNKIAAVVGGVGTFVTDVTYTSSSGKISVSKGGEPVDTVLTGVVNKPSYDSDTRTITLPVFGEDALVISLGKDAFVKSGSYNEETEEIDLVLTSGDEVHIPVGSLISIYTGLATSTATVTISDDKKISVDVKVSATNNNAIIIEEDGLYVPLPDAYSKKEIDDKFEVAAQDATTKANSALSSAKSYADNLNNAMNERVTSVESSLQWKTI